VPGLGDLPLRRLSPADIEPFYLRLLQGGGEGGNPLSLRTVRYAHTVLRAALEAAVRTDRLMRNPAAHARLPRRDPNRPQDRPRKMQVWNADQLRQFLETSTADPLHDLWVVAAGTGMRRGELLGLSWPDVDVDGAVIHVRRSLSKVGRWTELKLPKSGRTRSLAVDGWVLDALGRQAERQERAAAEAGVRWRNPDQLVFAGGDGGPRNPDAVSQAFRTAVDATSLPRIRLHDYPDIGVIPTSVCDPMRCREFGLLMSA
jgi:integrase